MYTEHREIIIIISTSDGREPTSCAAVQDECRMQWECRHVCDFFGFTYRYYVFLSCRLRKKYREMVSHSTVSTITYHYAPVYAVTPVRNGEHPAPRSPGDVPPVPADCWPCSAVQAADTDV